MRWSPYACLTPALRLPYACLTPALRLPFTLFLGSLPYAKGKAEREELICLLLSGDMGEILDTARISVAFPKGYQATTFPIPILFPIPIPFPKGDGKGEGISKAEARRRKGVDLVEKSWNEYFNRECVEKVWNV